MQIVKKFLFHNKKHLNVKDQKQLQNRLIQACELRKFKPLQHVDK